MKVSQTAKAAFGPVLFAGVLVMAGAVHAACPVASDLDTGIRFSATDGTYEVHRRLDAERVEIDFIDPTSTEISRTIVVHGTYLLWYGSIDAAGQVVAGTLATTGRPMQPSDMPVPTPNLEWVTSQVFTDANGPVQETMRATVGEAFTWQLGACAYEALPVTMVISAGDGDAADVANGRGYSEFVTYVPALGTGVFIGFEDESGRSDYIYSGIAVEGGN